MKRSLHPVIIQREREATAQTELQQKTCDNINEKKQHFIHLITDDFRIFFSGSHICCCKRYGLLQFLSYQFTTNTTIRLVSGWVTHEQCH